MNTILLFCLCCFGAVMQDGDVYELAMKGQEFTADQADALEQALTEKPDDINARTKLLGYFEVKALTDEAAKTSQARHVLWLVNNAPQSDILAIPYGQVHANLNPGGYAEIKKAWLSHLADESAPLASLKNAANFLLLNDVDLAEKTLKRGQAAAAKDPYWPGALGQLYSLKSNAAQTKTKRTALATKSLEQYELAYELLTGHGRDAMLDSLAKMALTADKPKIAKKYAEKMLNQATADWNSGNNVHHGNLILGRIALAADDMEEAKRRLLEAGKTKGSPQLGSFGPNMTLAKELLEADQSQVVLEYFELCREFWEMGKERLDSWSASVEKGEMLKFGGNLYY